MQGLHLLSKSHVQRSFVTLGVWCPFHEGGGGGGGSVLPQDNTMLIFFIPLKLFTHMIHSAI